jgi:hypothetical protein
MRKLAGQLGSEIQVEHHRSKWPSVLMALILLLGLGPLALEGIALCMSTWKEFLGIADNVKTPVLDGVRDSLNDMRDIFWSQITPWFRSMPWDPKMVLPVAAVVMVMAMLMLRRN